MKKSCIINRYAAFFVKKRISMFSSKNNYGILISKTIVMKNKINCTLVPFFIFFITLFSMCYANAQEKTKKQIKEEQKIEKQKKISKLVESKEFVFLANRMYPQSGGALNLTAEFDVEFHPDLINCFLPFIGRGFSGIGFGGDEGMKFKGKPRIYTFEKAKKAYVVKAEVEGNNDTFFMMLIVYFEGSATLSINSNNRSLISYDGSIEEFKNNNKTEN
jgi:hypothetical protein